MDELEAGFKIKGLWAKAYSNSEGNSNKIQPLYMKYRVQAIKDDFTALKIAYNKLSKKELIQYIDSDLQKDVSREHETIQYSDNTKSETKEENIDFNKQFPILNHILNVMFVFVISFFLIKYVIESNELFYHSEYIMISALLSIIYSLYYVKKL